MEISVIRRFRSDLRTFERIAEMQQKGCCCGVTLAQCSVLLELDADGESTMGELSTRLRLDNSTLTRTVEGLVRLGTIERIRDDADRRVVRVALTAQGKTTCRAIHKENDAICRGVFEHIPESKRPAVMKHFATLVDAFVAYESAEVEA